MLILIFYLKLPVYLKTDSMKLSPQKRISFEPTTTYLLKDLKPFTTYTFRLAARSKHGVGAYTSEISAETPQTRRSSFLSDRVSVILRGTDFQMHSNFYVCCRIQKSTTMSGWS